MQKAEGVWAVTVANVIRGVGLGCNTRNVSGLCGGMRGGESACFSCVGE